MGLSFYPGVEEELVHWQFQSKNEMKMDVSKFPCFMSASQNLE